jgi:acyl-CoA thioester hydrolase
VVEPVFRIYLEDTDAGGVVYHASYLRLMERARTEFLRDLGMQQSDTFSDDVSFVVAEMSVKFVRPARLDDLVRVSCVLEQMRAASFTLAQEVTSEDKKTVHCRAEVQVVCIRLTDSRPRRLPEALVATLMERA